VLRLSGAAAEELTPAAERARSMLLVSRGGDELASFIQRAAALYELIRALEASGGDPIVGFVDARGRFHTIRIQAPGARRPAAAAGADSGPGIAFELTARNSGATAGAERLETGGPWRALALYSLYLEQVAAGRSLAILDADGRAREVVP
jgi:hypothetical protein